MTDRRVVIDIKVSEFEDGETVNEITYRATRGSTAPDFVTLVKGLTRAAAAPLPTVEEPG